MDLITSSNRFMFILRRYSPSSGDPVITDGIRLTTGDITHRTIITETRLR